MYHVRILVLFIYNMTSCIDDAINSILLLVNIKFGIGQFIIAELYLMLVVRDSISTLPLASPSET